MQPILLKSKLSIPKLGNDVLWRSDLKAKLVNSAHYSVASIFAGAGYGKTTAVVQAVVSLDIPCCWYSPGPEDDNIFTFSSYLAGALEQLYPGFREWYFAHIEDEKQFNWKNVFSIFMAGIENYDHTISKPVMLVIDDWHLIHKDSEIQQFFDRFLACKPQNLIVIILSREKINLPEIVRLQVGAKLLEIQGADLKFSYDETYEFINQVIPNRYTAKDIQHIYDLTEGWIMVIRLFTNSCIGGNQQVATAQEQIEKIGTLFECLAHEVLVQQSSELQSFLLQSAILDSFDVEICRFILGLDFKYEYLETIFKKSLFLTEVGKGTYRYHQLFREFLIQEANKRIPNLSSIHIKAGYYYLKSGEPERALQHLILGKKFDKAIEVLCKISRDLVCSGRSRTMHHFLQQLPDAKLQLDIIIALGDEARFLCEYKKAIRLYEKVASCYHAANDGLGESTAYLGIGEIYLDIIQPLQAQKFLRRAYKVLPEGQTEKKAIILGLMAENMINQGNSKRAERYSRLARNKMYFEDKNNLEARILLRTGCIQEVIRLIEKERSFDKKTYHVPCSFRESSLILSVCYAYAGQAEDALDTAKQGIDVGDKLSSPFISAVGYARLGHALLIQQNPDIEQSWSAYEHSLDMSSKLDIPRGRTEVLQGQCLIYAIRGDWCAAKQCGHLGIGIAEKYCDRWFTAILYHTLGMSAALCQYFVEAEEYLRKGNTLFQRCGDNFGQAAAAWWFTYIAFHTQKEENFKNSFFRLLSLCNDYNYHFLLNTPSLLGDVNNFTSAPFFKKARQLGMDTQQEQPMNRLVSIKTVSSPQAKDPYMLRIQALGQLRVWCEGKEITASGWKRESSRQLLGVLLTTRYAPLHKETIIAYLWPEADFEAANRNFKVTLSNLMIVLEPNRLPRQPCSFIQRKGMIYQFNLSAQYYLDVDEFENLVKQAMKILQQNPKEAEQLYKKAISLYRGNYLGCDLQKELYFAEREHLFSLFMNATEKLTKLCIIQERYEEALQWADILLRHDKCWEQAYQFKMQCFGNMQNIPMVVRTYKKCCDILQEELCVKQSDKTTEIYSQIIS